MQKMPKRPERNIFKCMRKKQKKKQREAYNKIKYEMFITRSNNMSYCHNYEYFNII